MRSQKARAYAIYSVKKKGFYERLSSQPALGLEIMSGQSEERRIRGIARQIGLLKFEIRKENRKSTLFFFAGLTIGLLMNILVELLIV